MRIFVSYSSKDRDVVYTLVNDLIKLGHEVWFDQELTGGQIWWDQILEKIRQCELVVFALTPNSLDSFACRLEYTYATAIYKQVLPIMVIETNLNILPYLLSLIHVVDYRQRDYDALTRMVRALSNLAPFRPLPSIMPDPPSAPVSPLAMIRTRLEEASLSADDQASIFFRLKGLYTQIGTAKDARVLLQQLASRSDLFASVHREIQGLLSLSRKDQTLDEKNTPQTVKPPALRGVSSVASVRDQNGDTSQHITTIIESILNQVVRSTETNSWVVGLISLFKSFYNNYMEASISRDIILTDENLATLLKNGWQLGSDTVVKSWVVKALSTPDLKNIAAEFITINTMFDHKLTASEIRKR